MRHADYAMVGPCKGGREAPTTTTTTTTTRTRAKRANAFVSIDN